MTARTSLFAFFAACQLLAVGTTHATGTRPTAQAGRPAPARPAPAAPRPAAATAAPALLAAAAPVAATEPQPEVAPRLVHVSGTILGTDGQPRPGVSVFPASNPRLIAVTDTKGAFSLQLPATAGTIHLQADYFGVASSRIAIDGQHPQPISIVLGQ